jgi:CHASE3 domain sensor protein
MRILIRFIALSLLIAVAVTSVLVAREYRREQDYSDHVYTQLVRLHDMGGAARKAIDALENAEVSEQNYVLTGETIYFEAYTADIAEWQDEFSVLTIQAANGQVNQLLQDLGKTGDLTLKELALILTLYEGGSRDKALDRIRKGAGMVYLNQTRVSASAILREVDGEVSDDHRKFMSRPLHSLVHLAQGIAAIAGSVILGALLFFFEMRRTRDPSVGGRII